MFQSLTNNLNKVFDRIKNRGKITQEHLEQAMRDINIALLEADVSLPVAKKFIAKITEQAQGQQVIKSVSPADMIVKIVHDEMVQLLSSSAEEAKLNLKGGHPTNILLVGLQGSGKTTACAKLALKLKNQSKKVLLVSLDIYRPAAQEQLAILANSIGVDSLEIIAAQKPLEITERAHDFAAKGGYDIVIYDSAGRLHIDEEMIQEAAQVKSMILPAETLLLIDCMIGQDALHVAKSFDEKLGITGMILSRVDGDARGGAALSARYETGKPIKFLSTGEKPDQFEELDAERIASRILGMGDIVALVEKASNLIDKEEAQKAAAKMQKGRFDLNDYLSQLKMMNKMGGVESIMSMIPGISKFSDRIKSSNVNDKLFKTQEAIILSMTPKERRNPALLNTSRKQRVAKGAGVSMQQIQQTLKQFDKISMMVKKVSKMDPSALMSSIKNMF